MFVGTSCKSTLSANNPFLYNITNSVIGLTLADHNGDGWDFEFFTHQGSNLLEYLHKGIPLPEADLKLLAI
jgi:hypothetical protein